MVPIKLLHLILFFLVALHARAVGAAPLPAQGANEDGSNEYPASRLDVGLEPLGHLEDPGRVDRFPAGLALPVVRPKRNHLRGPPRARFQDGGGRMSPHEAELLMEILTAEEGGHELDQEAMKKEVFPERSGSSFPVSAAEKRLMQGATVLDAVHGRAMVVLPPKPTVAYVDYSEDVQRRWRIAMAAVMVFLVVGGLLWLYASDWWKKRKERQSASSSSPEKRDQNQQPPCPPSRGSVRSPSPSRTPEHQT